MGRIGDPIDLVFRHPLGTTGKFVRAHVFDATNAELAGSPVTLAHLSGGTYINSALLWPSTRRLIINFDCFNDAGFSVPDTTAQPERVEVQYLTDLLSGLEETLLTAVLMDQDLILEAKVLTDQELSQIINVLTGTSSIVSGNGKNTTGAAQPANYAWAYKSDNTVGLADANTFSDSDFAGVNPSPVADQGSTLLIAGGRVPGALTGQGFTAGQIVYLSNTPGQLSMTAGTVVVIIGKAIPANPGDIGEAKDLWVETQFIG